MAPAGGSRNRFAATCSRLRQYILEHQQQQPQQPMADVARVFQRVPPPPSPAGSAEEEAGGDERTLQLFPVRAGMDKSPPPQPQEWAGAEEEAPARKAPLTIFYGGHVVVFRDFPADKADKLMRIAGSVVAAAQPETVRAPVAAAPAAPAEEKPRQQAAALVMTRVPAGAEPDEAAAAACGGADEEPAAPPPSIARKVSVQRFLLKRKHRISGPDENDYNGGKPAEDDDEPPATWLRL